MTARLGGQGSTDEDEILQVESGGQADSNGATSLLLSHMVPEICYSGINPTGWGLSSTGFRHQSLLMGYGFHRFSGLFHQKDPLLLGVFGVFGVFGDFDVLLS